MDGNPGEADHGSFVIRMWQASVTRRIEAGPAEGDRVLELSHHDVELLERVLKGYLSDLRMEIVATDNPAMRRDLRSEEATLKALVERLDTIL